MILKYGEAKVSFYFRNKLRISISVSRKCSTYLLVVFSSLKTTTVSEQSLVQSNELIFKRNDNDMIVINLLFVLSIRWTVIDYKFSLTSE